MMMLVMVIVAVGACAQSESKDTLTLKQKYMKFLFYDGDICSPFIATKEKRVLYDEKNGIICTVEYYADASKVSEKYEKELSRLKRNKTVEWNDDIREELRQELVFDSCAVGLADVGNFRMVNVTDEWNIVVYKEIFITFAAEKNL